MTCYLTVLDVMAMNDEIMRRAGSSSVLGNEGALESAVMRPQMAAHYGEADLVTQAALLISGIALTHAFIDGNKRTALAAGTTFLILNGQQVISQPGEFGRQIVALVDRPGSLEEAMSGFVEWLRARIAAL